jgi:hypothetical protein
MKCLSLKQPYAFLLSSGKKIIELRKWNTKFRGEFLIHSSKKIDIENCRRLRIDDSNLITGAIIGCAFLYDVKKYSNNEDFIKDKNRHFAADIRYTEGYRYGFLVKDAKEFPQPIPYSGKLGFFEVDESIAKNKNK